MNKQSPAVKLSFTIRPDLLERVDAYASQNGMTRSGLISFALNQFLNATDALPSYQKVMNAMAAVTDGVLTGNMSPAEATARVDAIQATYQQLSKR